jgi:nicotinate phosphoribosyltransferase
MQRTAFNPIIRSLLETDLYKFTMLQAMLHHFPTNTATYRFVCRNTPAYPLARLVDQVNEQLDWLCGLRFTPDELGYMASLRFIKPDFVQFLRLFQLERSFIKVSAQGDDLLIEATGPQVHVMLFEIYVLAIVNETYFQSLGVTSLDQGRERLQAKIDLMRSELNGQPQDVNHPFEFFDFGLRRRFSGCWHDEVVHTLKDQVPEYFKGTSNVSLAKKYNLVPIGTMAHEYLQMFQAVGVQLRQSQKASLETWVQEYRGDLGTALTDVVGMDAFLCDFDLYFAKLFDGLRHDSGDPIAWGEKALAHYAKLRIDANSKRLVFSDGLDVPKALEIYRHFRGRVQMGFGIGTNLTNDIGAIPLNIVMKLVRCNDQPVAKLSDTPGKTLCEDETFLAYLRSVFKVTV